MKQNISLRMEKNKIIFMLLLVAAVLSIMLPNAQAIKTPKGIDGVVYDNESKELFKGIPVILENLDTAEKITLRTGKGTPGRYSAAINWDSGSNIKVSVTSPEGKDEKFYSLQGVIHGADLALPKIVGNYPPELTKGPESKATQEKQYISRLEYFDWNGDAVIVEPVSIPQNMHISLDGIISWTPNATQTGNINFSFALSDGQDTKSYNATINVKNINDAPIIISSPPTTILAGNTYTYKISAIDYDDEPIFISLTNAPEGMIINNNTVTWTPITAGEYNFSVRAIDTLGSYDQQDITVYARSLTQTQTHGSGFAASLQNTNITQKENKSKTGQTKTEFEGKYAITRIIFDDQIPKNTKIKITKKKTEVSGFVYYETLEINIGNNYSKNLRQYYISIDKKWLEKQELVISDLYIMGLDDDAQASLDYTIYEERNNEYILRTQSTAHSNIFIGGAEKSREQQEVARLTKTLDTKIITGKIVPANTPLEELNILLYDKETNTWFTADINKTDQGELIYIGLIHSNNAKVIEIYNHDKKLMELDMTKDEQIVANINLRRGGITGFVTGGNGELNIVPLLIIIALIAGIFIYFYTKKFTGDKK